MNICYLPFFLILPVALTGQYEKILQDKDVLWAAEVVSLLQFERLSADYEPEVPQAITLKVLQQEGFSPSHYPFTEGMYEMMSTGRWPAFADAALATPLSAAEARNRLAVMDTIYTFDPTTYEETIMVIAQEALGAIYTFQLRQLWYYNGKTNTFETLALAIAPARKNGLEYQPLAWFKLPEPKASFFDLQSNALTHATFVDYGLSEMEMETLKGADAPLKTILYKRLLRGAITGYDNQGEPIPARLVPELFQSRDTIITFDPETYAEKLEVVEYNYHPDNLHHYNLKQNWYFAPREGILQCRPVAVAPAVAVTNTYGQLQRLMPLFYWRRK
jgi:hypothetical protein